MKENTCINICDIKYSYVLYIKTYIKEDIYYIIYIYEDRPINLYT